MCANAIHVSQKLKKIKNAIHITMNSEFSSAT